MTTKNKEKVSVLNRKVTINISIPFKVLFKLDEICKGGERSEYITGILLKELDIK